METKLERITQLSKENPEMVFTSIGHLINTDMLRDCHREMDGKKAVGIDGVTKDDYEENLEENLTDLMDRMKRKAYHPKPARRVEIPKDNGKTRPLSIYCYEDKLVQEALRLLNYQLVREKTSWLIDADIKGFFDNIDHDWMMKFVGARIKDPRVLRLVRVMLKAGVVKDMGGFEPTEQGSGQGSVCSPILANIYMHYVLLWWFHERVLPTLKGYAGIVNYADDFVVCFQYKWEAERFYERLKRRMANFGLSLAEDKCRLIEFGRFAISNRRDRGEGKPETFDFLGFTHICSKSKNGGFRVRRKTSRKKLAKKGKEMHHKIGMMRAEKTANIIKWVNQVLVGYYRYYGVYGNYPSVMQFRWNVLKSLYYWLNRRSQTKSYTYEGFSHMIDKGHPIARPKAYYVYI